MEKESAVRKLNGLAFEVLNLLETMVVVFGRNHQAIICNRAFAQVCAREPKDITGRHVTELFAHETSKLMQVAMESATQSVEQLQNTAICTINGRFVVWSVTIISDPDDTYYICNGKDQTEREQTKSELQTALAEGFLYKQEASVFRESNEAVVKYTHFSVAAGEILNACKKLIGATCGYVALVNRSGTGHDVFDLDTGGLMCKVTPDPFPIHGLRDKAYNTGRPVYCNNFLSQSQLPLGHIPLENILFIPLTTGKMTIGLLALGNKPSGFSEYDIQLAPAFGEFTAIAISNGIILERLRDSEQRFRSVAQTAGNALITLNNQGEIIFWNNEAEKIFGYSAEEILSQTFTILIPEQFRQPAQEGFHQMLTSLCSEESLPPFEGYGLKKDGKTIPIEISPAVWETGEGVFFTGVIRDVTEWKRMKQELSETLEQYRSLVELSPDGIVVHSGGVIVYANSAAARLIHTKDVDTLIGKRVIDFVHPDFRGLAAERITKSVALGQTSPTIEEKFICADGCVIDVEVTGTSYFYKGNEANLVIVRDISDRKKMDEEASKATKLEAIGILAGGIAHDFNNILTVILGNLSLAKLYAEPCSKIYSKLKEIEMATLQTKDLTQQLLTFAKGGAPIKKTASVKDLVIESTTLALSGTDIICDFTLTDDLWSVEMDTGQIGQVIYNLISNSIQAMPEGGRIRVSAKNTAMTLDIGEQALSLLPGNYVRLTISDDGVGIPAPILPNIFVPFFTTKEAGSGLGLATSYAILKKHDGLITVEPEEGSGATFHIYLPASTTGAEQLPASAALTPGEGRVLIMDDEASVRNVAGEMLTYLGYEIDYAENGEEAIERFTLAKEDGRPYALAILDVTIRDGMGGEKAIRKLLEIDPEVKAIVSSGYSNSPVMARFEQYGFHGYVAKPYKIEELSSALNNVLGHRPKAKIPL